MENRHLDSCRRRLHQRLNRRFKVTYRIVVLWYVFEKSWIQETIAEALKL